MRTRKNEEEKGKEKLHNFNPKQFINADTLLAICDVIYLIYFSPSIDANSVNSTIRQTIQHKVRDLRIVVGVIRSWSESVKSIRIERTHWNNHTPEGVRSELHLR